MIELTHIRLEVRRDSEKDSDCYVSFKADAATDPHAIPADATEGERRELTRVDFFFHREPFEEFGSGRGFQLRDLWRQVDSWGQDEVVWSRQDSLYDRGRRSAGLARVPFLATTLPAFMRRYLLRLVRRVWDHPAFKTGADRWNRPQVVIEIDAARLARMYRLYGQGKGKVDIDASPETRQCLDECLTEREFTDQLERVVCIARNSTRGFHQRARVRMYAETWQGRFARSFGWAAHAPTTGRRSFLMNGGLIFHHDAASWSVHT